jgi:MFS family permease
MRPIGGYLFGWIADKHGRRTSMLISIVMMCGGSLMIACLPAYASIGVAAPVLLLVARLAQGLSVGGEYGTSATYMSEVAIGGQRGFYASFQYVTLIGGQLLAVLVVVIVLQFMSEAEIKAWGWRIPFFIGAATAVVAFYPREDREPADDGRALRLHDPAAGLRLDLRQNRPQDLDDAVRRARDAGDDPDLVYAIDDQGPGCRVLSHHRGTGDRLVLHLDQRPR